MLGLPFFTGINRKLKDVMRLTISGYFLTTTMSRQPTRPPWGCRVDRGTHSGVGHPWYPSLAAAGAGRVELPNTFRWRPAHICTGRRWWVSKQAKCVLTSTYCQIAWPVGLNGNWPAYRVLVSETVEFIALLFMRFNQAHIVLWFHCQHDHMVYCTTSCVFWQSLCGPLFPLSAWPYDLLYYYLCVLTKLIIIDLWLHIQSFLLFPPWSWK